MVLIIGAGVSGLAAAKCLNDIGIGTTIVDRYGVPGGAYHRMYSRIQLTSPASYLRLPGTRDLRGTQYLSAGEYASYISEYADRHHLKPHRRDVKTVQFDGSSFRVTFENADSSEKYSGVVVCTGMFDSPRMPQFPGMPAPGDASSSISVAHAANWRGVTPALGKKVVVVGGGVSAVEIAEECVRAGVTPLVSTTAESISLLPQRVLSIDPRRLTYPLVRRAPRWVIRRQCANGWRHHGVDRGFSEFQRRGLLEVRPTIRQVADRLVTFADGSTAEVDAIVLATGYHFAMPFLPEECTRPGHGGPLLQHGQSTVWPGLFFVGVPCAHTAVSHFVYGIAGDAQLTARQIQLATQRNPLREARAATLGSR